MVDLLNLKQDDWRVTQESAESLQVSCNPRRLALEMLFVVSPLDARESRNN